jgi:hypothetical protein
MRLLSVRSTHPAALLLMWRLLQLLLAAGSAAQGYLGPLAAAAQLAVYPHLLLLLQHLLLLLIQWLCPCLHPLQLLQQDLPGALQQMLLHACQLQALLREQQWALPLAQRWAQHWEQLGSDHCLWSRCHHLQLASQCWCPVPAAAPGWMAEPLLLLQLHLALLLLLLLLPLAHLLSQQPSHQLLAAMHHHYPQQNPRQHCLLCWPWLRRLGCACCCVGLA